MRFSDRHDLWRNFSLDCDIIATIILWFIIIISIGLSRIVILLLFFGYFVFIVSLDRTNTLGHCHWPDQLIIRYLLDLTLNFLCEIIILSLLYAHDFFLFQRFFTTLENGFDVEFTRFFDIISLFSLLQALSALSTRLLASIIVAVE